MKDRNNNEIMGESFAVKDKNSLRISLNRYLIEIQRQETIDFRFCIKLKDNADRIITSFLIARVQEEVIIEECLYNEIENEGFIEWKEKGTKINRECVLVNFTKPWQKPICKFIPDGECKLSICLSDMTPGIYKYTIRKVQDQLFMSEESDEVCTLRDFQRGIIKVKGTEENQSSMQTYLAELLRTRFMKKDFALDKIKILDSNLDKVQSLFPIDVMPLSYAYIVIIRYYQQKEDNQEVIKLFNQLYEKFLIYNKDIMKLILDSSISNVYKKILIHKFGCNNLTSLKGINDIQKRLLLEIDDDASGFIYFTQNDPRGLNWAAISDYEILRKVDDNGKCKVTTFLTEANFGRIAYITQFYEFLYKSMQRPKNIDKSTEEFLKEFHNEYKVDETLIFGKTRLKQLVEWKDAHKNVKEIEITLSSVIKIPCDQNLRMEYESVFNTLDKRHYNDELGYYIGLVALYATFIRYGLMEERIEFSKLLNYTIENTEKLYYRDAILFELYLHRERGLEWA
jgi:hypothetical protein